MSWIILKTIPNGSVFVFDSMTDNQSEMVFLNHLPEPIELQNGEKKTTIRYFGIAQDMEQLNPYFNCDAYDGNNSVYVLDDNGFKLFNSNQVELIKGHNVFSVLQNMKYLHNSSFDKTKAELEEKGCSYSNAVLDGIEYFYGLKRMENAEWTLIFLVPAEYVAANTLKTCQFCHDIYRYLYGYRSSLRYTGDFLCYAQKPAGSDPCGTGK